MKLYEIDPAAIDAEQMLRVFEKDFEEQHKTKMSPGMCAGFVAGMAAGIAMSMMRDLSGSEALLRQCVDMARLRAQLEAIGVTL